MTGRTTTSRTASVTVRGALVWVSATVAAGILIGWLRPDLAVSGGAPGSLDVALARGAALVGSACLGWLWLVTGLTVLEAIDAKARARLGCPPALRRLVLLACGVALAGGAVPAQAADQGHRADARRGAEVVAGLVLPERTFGATAPVRQTAADHAQQGVQAVQADPGVRPDQADRPAREVVVVAPGDSLWTVAARLLPATAPAAEVDALWRRIYAANRALIGADPGLIRPGQQLRVPEGVR